MFDRLGKHSYVLPIIGVIVICFVMSLALYPMLHAQPENVPMAVVSLDKGATTPQGEMNAGDRIVKQITGAANSGDEEAIIKWDKLESQDVLDKALQDNQYYGALVIPEYFTMKQMAAQEQAAGEQQATGRQQAAAQTDKDSAPTITIIINQGKNAMLATTMQNALTAMADQIGIKAEIETVHPVSSKGGAFSALMGGQIAVLPLVMMSMIAAILLFFSSRKAIGFFGKSKILYFGIAYAIVLSFLVSWGTILVASVFGNIDMPVGTTMLFLWIASFAVIMLIFGSLNIAFPLGVAVLILVFACGMSLAMIPLEMLPDFWADWIYPWIPQHYIGDGMREILYMDGGLWNPASLALVGIAAVGIALAAIGAFISRKVSAEEFES